ncbi:MAG: hypothetical protein R2788_22335 [Saprospiraceae bacterium]
MAITALRYAAQAARELGLTPNPDWEHVAENIPILKFPDGTTKENATYNGQTIKQADVNLLAYPLNIISDPAQVKKDLDYYEKRMSPEGPAMGTAILCVLASRLGNPEKAASIFSKSYKPNEVPPFACYQKRQEALTLILRQALWRHASGSAVWFWRFGDYG